MVRNNCIIAEQHLLELVLGDSFIFVCFCFFLMRIIMVRNIYQISVFEK